MLAAGLAALAGARAVAGRMVPGTRARRPAILGLVVLVAAWWHGTREAGGLQPLPQPHPLARWVASATLAREPLLLEARVRSDATITPTGSAFFADVTRAWVAGRPVPAPAGIRVGVAGTLAGTRLDAWRKGRTVRFPATVRRPQRYRNPGVPDQAAALARRRLHVFASVKSAALVEVISRAWPWEEAAGAARAWVRRAVGRHVGRWSASSAGVTAAILVGDRSGLDRETEQRLQRAGTFHVVAISGGNIAIFTALLLGVARCVGLGPRAGALLAALGVGGYALVVGGAASVARATLVAEIYLLGRILDLRAAPVNVVAAAAAVLAVAAPSALLDAGTALTFGATIGILLGVPVLTGAESAGAPAPGRRRALGTLRKATTALGLATLCAGLAVLPVGASVFSRVSVAGLFLNFLAVPLMTVVQVGGLAALAAAPLSDAAGTALGWVTHAAARALVESARLLDLAPWLSWRVPAPPVWVVCAYYVAWGAWLAAGRPRARGAALAAALATGVFIATAPVWRGAGGAWHVAPWLAATGPRAGTGWLEAVFLDVGQGDAALVRLPDGRGLLVDAGGVAGSASLDVGERFVAPALWALGLRRLWRLALTHGHPDHIGGASAIVEDFQPDEAWEGIAVPRHAGLAELEARMRARGRPWRQVRAGETLRLGKVELRVLHPPAPDWERRAVRNDDSIVLDVRLGGASLVLTGDAGRAVEARLAAAFGSAAVRVVKVPHHGSRNASSAPFIEALRPAVAVVSVGAGNPFGHPAPDVLARYHAAGGRLFRTDRDGAVWVATDGRCLWARTAAGANSRVSGPGCRADAAAPAPPF